MQVEALAGTPNWLAARRGMLTASRMNDAAAFLKAKKDEAPKPAEARVKLMQDLAAEILTGVKVDNFVSPAMQWGIDQQAHAISAFEAATGELVGPEVFVLHPTIPGLGATPDGLVGSDAVLEVKCPTPSTFVRWVLEGTIPDQHKLQMATQCACTGRSRAHFVAFDPRMPAGRQLFRRVYEPTADEIANVEKIAREFLAELEALIARVNEAEYA